VSRQAKQPGAAPVVERGIKPKPDSAAGSVQAKRAGRVRVFRSSARSKQLQSGQ
jgi:hypothetical protein